MSSYWKIVVAVFIGVSFGAFHSSRAQAAATVPYLTDFESGIGSEWSLNTRDNSLPDAFSAFTGRFNNQTQTLSLENLTVGESYTIGFDLFILDSWDGDGHQDSFIVSVDGTEKFRHTFSNFGGAQSYPNAPDQFQNFGFGGWNDSIFRNVEISFVASAATAQLSFRGQNLQDIGDESWGIDNVSVRLTSTLTATEIRSTSLPAAGATAALAIDRFNITATRDLLSASANTVANYDLRSAGSNEQFGDSDDTIYTLAPSHTAGKIVSFQISDGPLQPGKFRFSTTSGLLDANNSAVTAFTREFTIAHPVIGRIENTSNNTLPEATPLPVTETPSASRFFTSYGVATFFERGDVDYWRFDAEAGDRVTIRLEADAVGVYPQLYLQNSAAQNIVTVGGDYNGLALIQNAVIPSPGTYYLRIFTDNNPARYQFRLDQSRAPQLEQEPNDAQNSANNLSLAIASGNYQARIAGALVASDGSGDYFRFGTLNVGNAISLNLSLPTGTTLVTSDVTMSILLEGSDTELASSNSGALNYTVTTDGVHYVRLQTDNRQLRAQYYLHAIVTDGTAPVVSTVSLPAESGSSSAVLDRVTVQFSEQPEPVLSRIGRNYLTYNGHVYFATSSSKTWVSAEAEAQGLGGHLVTINDAAENEWVRQNFNYLSTVWIGFNDQAAEGTFVWASGESSDFTNWQGGEPNNSGDEDFASMYTSGAWNDAGPGQSYFGVIEVSGTDTDGDGLPDAADPYPTDRLNAFDLRAAGADGNFDTADDQLYSLASVGYDGGLSATFVVVDGPLQPGNYRFTVTTALKDRAGNPLATAFVRHFTVNNVPGFVLENRANDSQVTATPLGSAGTGADGSFFNRGTYGAGSNPYFVTAGHFNADTQPDLAVANISSGNVTVYIGRGSGLYHSGVYYPSGNGPIALAVGDFNADSKSDLAVANYYGSTMSVLLGNGDGTFQTATSYGTDVNPRSVVTADFNGDGKPDLATANQSRANVSVFLGNGDGTFQNGVHFPAANGPHSIAAADLNKDNKTDLVVVNTSSDNVSILLGQGDGTFPAPVNYAVQNAPRSVAIGDVNGDTKLDLAVLNAGVNPNSVSVLLGNDDGTFANAIHYPIEGGDPYQVILTTVNADGALDVVVASYGSGRLVFLFNNGDGTFGGSVSHYIPGNPISVVAGDFSGDGIMDLATGNYGHSNMNVLTGNRPTLLAEDPAGTGVRSGFGRGNLTDREDWDFWSFSGNAGDLLSVAVEIPNSPPASQLYYRIDYPDGERFFDFYASSYNGWGESRPNSPPLVLPKSGTYTVRVSYNYEYFGEYRLRVTLARPPMQMESEDNNNLNQADAPALTLATGRQTASVLGYIGVGDPEGDFFRLGNLAAGTTITLGLTQPSTSGLAGVLSIYNSSGANVATSAAGASSLEFTVPAEGDDAYYARVTSAGPKHVTGSSTPLSFDGGDDYVDLGAWSPGNRWTVSAWVRPAGYDSRRRNIVGGYADCRDWGITLQNGDFGVVIRQPGGCSQTVPSGITPSLGTWYHVLATSDGTTAKIYVNGSLRNSAAVDPEYIGTPNGTRIGGEVCCGGNNFPGLIDEVSIWDRALSDEEVTSLFNTALEGTESGLVGYWKLNEGTGTTVADRSTQSRNGTLANGAAWVSVGAATATPAGLLSQYILSIELADTLPPSLVGDNLPKEGSSNPVFLDRFSLSFSEDMLATSVNDSASYDLRAAGADGNFDTGDDELYTVVSNGYSSGLSAGYTIGDGPLQPGNYRFTAKTTLKDRAENPLSSAYVRQFSIAGVNGFIGENRNNNTPGTATSISPAPGTSPDGSFAAGSNFGAANNPYFVSAAMLNNDAFLDLVVANYGSDNLSVLLGNGDGTFQARVNYGAGNGPLALAVADLNQDGRLDVISGNHNSRNISVLLGNGDGTLQTPVNYNVGNNPRSVAVGDVNGDNMLDVAVANQNTANVSVLLGNGDGTLQAAVNHATGNGPHGVALRDVNGDNKLDLAVVNVSSDTMSVLLGNGDATFQAPVNYPTDNAPRSVAVGDVNSDSKLDLVVVTSSNPNYLNVFLGNGDGTFADRVSYATGGSDPYHLVLVDLNNDSKLDGVVANYGASRVGVLLNNGDGTFGNAINYSAGRNPISIAPGDFNRDGRLDLAAANYNGADVTILFGNNTEMLVEDSGGTGLRIGSARGNISNGNDVDYWSFTGLAGDRVNLAVDIPGNPPASSLYFRINRPDGSNWSYSDFTTTHFGWGQNSHPPGETALILPATGTYTIQVQFNHAYTGEYRFRLTLARPPIQVEREDNNAINQANSPELALTAGHQTATVLGYISIGDGAGDFYRLGNLANGTTIHLNLTQPASSGFGNVLGIYNPAGALVARSEIGAASLTYPVPEGADGTYYARVTEEGPSYAIKFGAAEGFALNFDGVDDIVTTGVGLIPNSGDFTVEAWAYGLDMGGYREIISQGSGGNAFYLGYDTGNNIRSGDGWGSTGIPFPFHGWHHLAIVKSATDTKLYVDGVLRASRGGTIPNPAANTPFTIGKQYGPYGEYWPGGVDEVRVWNVARTAEEIQQNYASALTGNEAGLIGYWKFDEGSGTTLADASSQGQAGTIVGEPRWLSTTGGFRQTRGMYAQYLLSIDLADTLPPTITGDNLPAEGSDNFIVLDRFTLNFSEDMLASTVTDSASYELRSAGADDAFDTADDALYAVVSTGYSAGLSGGYSISNGPLQPGRYRFTAGTNLKDRAQNPLASPYVRQFAIRAVPGFFFESRDNNSRGTATSLSPAPGTGADGSVSTGGSYGAANNPYFVSAVLLNNDAFHDLVVANYGSDNISVLLGNGDGTFQTRVNYGAGNGPLGLGVVDLNGDTRLDVVTVNHNSHNVSILLGNGDGTFQAAVNYAVGRNPRVIAIGDLNGDNKLDLATANQGTANASVLIGNGDGTFQAAVNYATGNSPYGIVARDFNGDSKIDLAVSNQGSDNVTVMLGVGDGTFQAPVPYATPNAPRSLAAGDINADGKLDLVVNTSSNPNYVTVFPGNGDGSFAAGINYATGGSDPYHVVLPDLNGDSKLDVVVANYGSSRVSILLNNGDGTLGNALVFPAGRNPISIAPADFNRDGRLDLAAANYNSADVTILFGNNTEFLTEDPTGSGIRTSAGRGNVSSNADDDFWSFSAKAGDRLMVAGDIPGNPGASSLYYRIDRPDGNILHDFTTTHFGWGQSEPVVIPADGTYTLQVRFNHGYTGEYRFRVTLAAPPVQLENEDENNALASANKPLEGGLTQAKVLGYVSVGDPADFFSLGNLANGTTVNLGFTRPNSSRLAGVMKVFNASGNEVASSPAGAPALSFAVPAGADGAYYARVTAGTPGHAAGSTGSVSFDGSNDSADLGNWFNYQTFTISMWLRPRSTQQSYADIVDNNHRNGINWVVQQDVDRVNNYNWYAADGSAGVPFVLAPNVWQHLTVTRDSERVSKVYINGQLIGSTTGTGDINYDGNRFLRLARFGGGGRHWNGFMDEVAIWDRALNDAEVAATMNQRLAGTENGLVGYWGFNETSGTTASDATANARNATLVNGAFFAPLGTVEDADPGLFAQYILDINLADNVPPVVTGNSLPGEGSSLEVVVDRFTLTFSEDMLAQSVTNPASYDLRAAGPDELFGTPDDEIYAVAGSYSSGLTASFSIADGPLQPGLYRFSALTSLQDRAGNFLATPHVRQFTVAPISGSIFESRNNGTVDSATPLNPGLTPDPVGNNVRAVLGRGNIASTSDLDYWSFDAEAGDLMMLGADVPNNPANSSLHYRIERPNGSVLHEFDTANTGRGQSPPLTLAEAGAYRVRVSYNNQYFGEYRFRVWLTKPPMALENDENQGTGNGSVATASTLPLTTSGDNKTGSALGYLRATGDLDYFNLGTLTSGSTVYLNTRLLAGSQFNPVVSLYDASNGYRIEAGSGRADDGVAEVRIEQTGTYYAVVRGNAAGLRESYVLDVQVVPTGSVSFPNLQVTGITPPSGSIRSGQEVAFSFTVQNVGSVATPAPDWMDRVVVSQNDILGDADDTLIGIHPHNGALNPTDNYTVNQTGRLPDGINGPHYLIVQTDFGNAVNEFVLEADNVTVSTAFTVTRADYPDLKVENLTVTGPSVNNEFTINWTTANRGAAAANGGFKERLFVRNLRTGAILVNEPRDVASDLVAGATLPQSATVMTVVPGNYQVLVTTDSQNDFFEFDAVSHASAEQNTAEAGFAITQFFNVNVQPNPAEGGSVTGGGTFASGTSVTVTATPNTTDKPYRFLNWTENGLFQSANSSFTFTLGRDRSLVANFTLPLYAVTAANNPSAGGVVIGTGNVFHGNTATLTARPNAGYKFVNWTKDGTVVGTELTLSVVITGDYAVVANYEEANPFHDVTTATDPAGIAQVTGAGRYNNGQSVVISAPETITASPNVYTFRQFNLNGVRVSTSASFTKTFTTADPKDMAFVAVYDTRTILPTVANVTANMPNPVPLTATYQLDIRFDRSMDPAVAPAIVLDGPQQINVPGTGTWSSGVSGNDTYRTPNIAFSAGMDGTYAVKVSGGRDLSGGAVAEASVYTTIVDVTAPAHPTLTLGATSNTSATVNWADYAAPADLSGFRVYIQTTTFNSTAGLTALTRLGANARSYQFGGLALDTQYYVAMAAVDNAGNSTPAITAFPLKLTSTVPPPVAITVEAAAVNAARVAWTGYDTSSLLGFAGFHVYLQESDFSTVTGLTPVASLGPNVRETRLDNLDRSKTYFIAVVGYNRNNEFNANVTTRTWSDPFAGNITSNLTIGGAEPSTIDIFQSINVANNATLTVTPGTTLRFARGTGLTVEQGKLVANGTALDPIVFTSAQDVAGGSPAAGDWNGIALGTGGAASSLEHVFVKFGKGLSIAGGSPTLAAFTARNNSGAGLTLSGGATVTTADGLFLFNEAGILQTENARLTISNSVLKNNAIDARNTGGSQLVARQNWWGTLDAIEIATRVNGDVDTAGFLDYEPLLTPAIGIVGGSLNVGNRNVALRFACRTAAEMRVSENSAFVNAFFGPFATPQNFLLSEGGGEKTVYAQFRSITGRASTPVSLTLNYITDGPVIRAFNLSEGQTLPRPFTVTGNATAILGMAAIEFYVDDILQQSIAGGSYSHLLDVRTFSSGIHRVKLLARDNSGNIATLERNVFFNVTPPPAPVITTPADNLIVANNRLDVAGTAEAGIVLRITRNGTPVGNTTADANGNFGVTGISLVEGQNLIVAVASDSVGSSSSAPRSVVLDSGAPARLIMDAPVYRPGLGLDVTWHYPADGERATRFQLYWHTASFNDPAQATGQSVVLANMDYGVRGLANTTYYFGVVGLDDAGNRSPLSELISFNYDDTAPVLTLAFDKPQPVGLGQLRMTLTANEALAAKPILAFQPEGAPAPIAVPLTEVALNTYEGTYNIHQFVPSGRAEFRASARDLAGNSVNRKPVNGDLLIDVQPPVGEIATAPLGPVQTVNPVNVAVNLTLTEAAKVGTSPTLSFRPPTGEAVAIALTGEGTVWNGTLALAPTMGSGFGQFVLSVRDALDNVGTQITTGAQLEIYNTDLPSPPSTPSGLQATTLPGGQIRLHWEAVENAEIYRLYREPAPANAPATLVADNIANAEYVDLPPADGDFVYAISASRRGAESAKSSPVPGRSDRTPPSAPTNVEAQLVASGVQISWEQPAGGEAPTKFNIYRNDQLVKSVSRVAPVIDVPPRGIMNYVVASVDAAGNENRSTAATIQMLVGAVNNLQVLVNIGQAPSLTWASGDPTTTGYNVYRNGIKQNAAPLTATSFTDALPLGGDVVQYAVRAVNAAGEESSSRTVNVYSVDLSLLANNAGGEVSGSLISSYFDNFAAKVSNLTPNSTLPLREIELRRTISSGEALTRTLGVDADIGSGNWLTRQVVFPGAKILAAQSVRFRAIQETDIGGSSVIYQDVFDFTDVANPGVMIEITANQLPLAGGLTPFDVRIFNRGFADLDFLVTSNRGTDHGDLYVSVKDAQGQEVSRAYFQGTPPGTRFTADGRGYLSVAPGSSVRLTVPDVLVPESLAVNSAVTFQAAIDQIYYKLGSNEQLVSGPLRGEMRSALSQTPYFGTAQTDLTSYPNDTPIIITGQAINRATSQPVPNAPLKIGFSTRGFNWDQPITTDENGNYRYEYRPPQGLSGSLTIWAAHPDVFDVLNQARIEIFRIYASPARGDIRMSKNDSFTFRISLINPGDRELTQFAVTSTAYRMDGQNRVPVNNVVGGANLPEGFVVRPGETRSIDLTLTAAADAPDNAVVEFTLTSAEGASAMFTATVTLLPAVPVLAVTDPPLGYLEVSVDRGGFISRQITVVNRGLKDLEGVELVPPAQVPWIVPNLAKSADGKIHLPDIRIGESYSFTVVFAPPAETPLGQASDFLIIKGANAQAEFRINIFPLVTSDKKGAVQFYVDDVLGLPVPDATIRLRNTALQVELPAVKTDQDGYVTVREMQEGNWSWLITAPGHSSAVGIVEVIPGQTVQVGVPKTRLNKSLVTVTFRVEPVPFTDRYEIKIEQTFETHVPAPVLVLTPPVLEFRDVLPGFEANFVVKAKNHGLIEMTDVTITGTDAPSGRLEPLINYFPVLRAQEEVEVPFRLVYTGTPSGPQGLMARQGPGGFPVGCGGGDLPSLADAIAGMNALFKGGYICAASDAAKLAVAQGLLITLYLWQTQVNKVYKYAYKLATVLTCLGIFSGDGGGGGGGGGGSGPSNGTVGNFGMSGPVCFAAGTPVLMADGTTKPIEQITTNDWIRTGQAKGAVANVVETFATTTDKVREVKFRIEDGSGAERSLQTTDDHLFWVDGKGWTLASEVQPGAWLTTEKGQRATVLANVPLGKSLKVYTFKAREDHAFYAHGVLVHDMCGEWQPQPAGLNQVTSR